MPDKLTETELFLAMRSCKRWADDDGIREAIEEMRARVEEGEDPEEVLHDEGFEPDYVFDIMDL